MNRKKVADVMRKEKIFSKSTKRYEETTNFKYYLPVYDNILNRDFKVAKPNMKIVSDATYIPTDEGWLYLASAMDRADAKS